MIEVAIIISSLFGIYAAAVAVTGKVKNLSLDDAKKDVNKKFLEAITQNPNSDFWLAQDSIFFQEMQKLWEKYSKIDAMSTKWWQGWQFGCRYFAFEVICGEDEKKAVEQISKKLAKDCLERNSFSSKVWARWLVVEEIPVFQVFYVVNKSELEALEQLVHKQKIALIAANNAVLDPVLEKELQENES